MPFADVRVIFRKSGTIIWQNFQIIVNFQISRFIAELVKTEEIKKHTKKSTVKEQDYSKMSNRFVLNRERFYTKIAKRKQFVLNRERFNTN